MNLAKSAAYDPELVRPLMMGPSALMIVDELTSNLPLRPGMRVLDLGCGMGLTSLFLAKEFGVTVFATDLWISASDNYERIRGLGLDHLIVPIHAEARVLPYASGYFDAVVSVDAYHYFGADDEYLPTLLAPLVKRGGVIAVAVPGVKWEFWDDIPEAIRPYLTADMNFHTGKWWKDLWERSGVVSSISVRDMECFDDAWAEWLTCDNDYARGDVAMIAANAGRYMNLVAITATVG
ncbi:MAG TPA: methyltransferase domain-containing protein [Capsulimonadaceae bacterium]|jgi:cyclopropane fatty-acyl-phospholipid synthase-like methyltransferase